MPTLDARVRKPRADSERNRHHLIDVARAAFAEHGAAMTLKEIAARAGVGIGTLYRHFPTREALLDEIYLEQSHDLLLAADRLLEKQSPIEALHRWLELFIAFLDNRQVMADVLQTRESDEGSFCTVSGETLVETLAGLLARAKQAGETSAEVEAIDILTAIAGIASYGAEENWRSSAERLVAILIAGLRA